MRQGRSGCRDRDAHVAVIGDVCAGRRERLAGRGVRARCTAETADELAHGADVLVDGSDDPATKFLVADHARAHARPYVIAAALRYGGNVFAGAPGSACYRCLFEDPPDD